jgi:hypothetical protein
MHTDQDTKIMANELFFLPAVRRVRAENDMPASEVEPQITAPRNRGIQKKQSPVAVICLRVDRA